MAIQQGRVSFLSGEEMVSVFELARGVWATIRWG